MSLNTWFMGNGTVRKYGPVGGNVSLWRQALMFSMLKFLPLWNPVSCLLPVDQDVKLSAPSPAHVCLYCPMLPSMMIMD